MSQTNLEKLMLTKNTKSKSR